MIRDFHQKWEQDYVRKTSDTSSSDWQEKSYPREEWPEDRHWRDNGVLSSNNSVCTHCVSHLQCMDILQEGPSTFMTTDHGKYVPPEQSLGIHGINVFTYFFPHSKGNCAFVPSNFGVQPTIFCRNSNCSTELCPLLVQWFILCICSVMFGPLFGIHTVLVTSCHFYHSLSFGPHVHPVKPTLFVWQSQNIFKLLFARFKTRPPKFEILNCSFCPPMMWNATQTDNETCFRRCQYTCFRWCQHSTLHSRQRPCSSHQAKSVFCLTLCSWDFVLYVTCTLLTGRKQHTKKGIVLHVWVRCCDVVSTHHTHTFPSSLSTDPITHDSGLDSLQVWPTRSDEEFRHVYW